MNAAARFKLIVVGPEFGVDQARIGPGGHDRNDNKAKEGSQNPHGMRVSSFKIAVHLRETGD